MEGKVDVDSTALNTNTANIEKIVLAFCFFRELTKQQTLRPKI